MPSACRSLLGPAPFLGVLLGLATLACAPAPSVISDSSNTPTAALPTEPSVEPAPPAPAPAPAPIPPSGAPTHAAYSVIDETALEGISATCADGESLYNGCSSTPLAFHWQDHGTGHPTSVKVEIRTSIFCADPTIPAEEKQLQALRFNGSSTPIGSFEGDLAACTCSATGETRTFELDATALAAYHPGDDNVVRIEGPNRCLGLQKHNDWAGAFARISVTY
jgi:hypothetical protein